MNLTPELSIEIEIMKPFYQLIISILFGSFIAVSCEGELSPHNVLTENEKAQGWELLFDGKSMQGWHLYNRGKVPSAWFVKDGELGCYPYTIDVKHGDLITDRQFKNFELKFDWKISNRGNSGVFINVQEDPKYKESWNTGVEYQILDHKLLEEGNFYKNPTRWSGAVYGFCSYEEDPKPNPTGEWNEARIQQMDGRISFWLNGEISSEVDMNEPDWTEMIAHSEFKDSPDFGKFEKGHIGLQYWSNGVTFRNIKILEL